MPFYQFKCDKCDHSFEESIYLDGKDPPDYYKCPNCKNKKAPREYWTEDRMPGGFANGLTDRRKRENRKFYEYGYNKQQAENFYKESIEASKERMSTGHEHYKEVLPDMKQHLKQGILKANPDEKRVKVVEQYKKLGVKHLEIKDQITKVKKK